MNLTPRLLAAAELCGGAKSVIDVGCDHAHLCVELIQRGAARAYASDIREGPLRRARETIARCGMGERIQAVLCDGLHGFSPDMADAVIICGMGGRYHLPHFGGSAVGIGRAAAPCLAAHDARRHAAALSGAQRLCD